ncbi:hypothetical protein ABKV19_002549 [Rosa sericea]
MTFIFADEFLSVPEFAVNPPSQFWLGGRRYWGRGIGARPHLRILVLLLEWLLYLVFGFKKLPEVGWRAKRVSSLHGTVFRSISQRI